MENISSEDEIYNLWLALIKAKRCISRARERELLPHKITPEQASVLYILNTLGKETTRIDIARLSCRDLATVSGIVERMRKKGLLKLRQDTKNKRITRISLTKKGEEAYQKTIERGTVNEIFSVLSEEERQQLKDILEKVMAQCREQLIKLHKPCYL